MKHFNNLLMNAPRLLSLLVLLLPISLARSNDGSPTAELWARATPPGSDSGAIYGVIRNRSGDAIALNRVDLYDARHVMVHRTVEEDGVMRMRHATLSLDPESSISLQPGGLHIMVMGLTRPFREGCLESVVFYWADGRQSTHTVRVGGYGQQARPDVESVPCN